MRKLFFVLFLLFPISFVSSNAWAITVKLEISCKENVLCSETISAINTEFRRLGDVSITDRTDADFFISIIALETKNVAGYITGITYSTVVLKRFNNLTFISLLPKECFQYKKIKKTESSKELSKEDKEFLSRTQKLTDKWQDDNKENIQLIRKEFWIKMTDNLLNLDNHFINSGARNDVQDICRRVVAMIDADSFERFRKVTH
jgi:hypothetical protein